MKLKSQLFNTIDKLYKYKVKWNICKEILKLLIFSHLVLKKYSFYKNASFPNWIKFLFRKYWSDHECLMKMPRNIICKFLIPYFLFNLFTLCISSKFYQNLIDCLRVIWNLNLSYDAKWIWLQHFKIYMFKITQMTAVCLIWGLVVFILSKIETSGWYWLQIN